MRLNSYNRTQKSVFGLRTNGFFNWRRISPRVPSSEASDWPPGAIFWLDTSERAVAFAKPGCPRRAFWWGNSVGKLSRVGWLFSKVNSVLCKCSNSHWVMDQLGSRYPLPAVSTKPTSHHPTHFSQPTLPFLCTSLIFIFHSLTERPFKPQTYLNMKWALMVKPEQK